MCLLALLLYLVTNLCVTCLFGRSALSPIPAGSISGNVVFRVLGGGLRSRSGLNVARVVSGEKYRWMRWPLTEVRVQIQGISEYRRTWLKLARPL